MRSERWVVLALLFAARTTIAYQFQSVAAVGPLLVGSVISDFATLGALIGCYMLPGVALAFPGGMLDQRFGGRKILMFGLSLMAAGGGLMAVGGADFLFFGRILSGSGAAILNVVLARAVGSWFAPGELAGVMGAFVASWPLGVALALVTLPAVMVSSGWTALSLAALAPTLICLVLLGLFYKDGPEGKLVSPVDRRPRLSRQDFQLATVAGVIWGLYNVTYVVLVASLPEFFAQRGYAMAQAAAISSILGWALLVFLPVGGYVAQRIGSATLMLSACFLLIAAGSILLAVTDWTVTAMSILVVAIGLPAGAIMALPAQILPPAQRPVGMGLYFTIFYLAMAALPGVAGIVREAADRVNAPILFAGGTIMLAWGAVLVLDRLRRPGATVAAPAA